MGIYDRDYLRDDEGGPGWPIGASVCQTIVIINIVAFIAQLATLPQDRIGVVPGLGWFTMMFDLAPQRVFAGEVWRILTHAFLHNPFSWGHIAFNMLAFYFLGREVEQIYGPREFLAFYLVAAILGGIGFLIQSLITGGVVPALGASGAVTAVMVVFAMHYPNRIFLLFFVIPVPAYICVILFVAMDLFGVLGARPDANVAYSVHLAGAAFGFLYARYNWRVLNWWPNRMSMRPNRRVKPKLRVYLEESEEPPAAPNPNAEREELLEEQLDLVLAKVARHGKESLSQREQEILQRASEIYKQRRK